MPPRSSSTPPLPRWHPIPLSRGFEHLVFEFLENAT
jgi:hypothetical protein